MAKVSKHKQRQSMTAAMRITNIHTHTHMRATQRVDDEPVLYFVSFRTAAC